MEDNVFISQSKYAKSLVKKFDFEKTSHKRTPAATYVKLTREDNGVDVDQSIYRRNICILLYLTTSIHDITFFIGVCARYQAKPKASHPTQVKRIVKYINGTCDYGIIYSHDTNPIIVGYCDIDWIESVYDRKSTSGGFFLLATI